MMRLLLLMMVLSVKMTTDAIAPLVLAGGKLLAQGLASGNRE